DVRTACERDLGALHGRQRRHRRRRCRELPVGREQFPAGFDFGGRERAGSHAGSPYFRWAPARQQSSARRSARQSPALAFGGLRFSFFFPLFFAVVSAFFSSGFFSSFAFSSAVLSSFLASVGSGFLAANVDLMLSH